MTTEKKIEKNIILQCGNILHQIPNLRKAEKDADYEGIKHILSKIESNLNTIGSYEIKLYKLDERITADLTELKDEQLTRFHLDIGKNEIELEKKIKLCTHLESEIKSYGVQGNESKEKILNQLESDLREIQQHASNILHFEIRMNSRLNEIRKLTKELVDIV